MTRRQVYQEILRLDEELQAARGRMKDAQARFRAMGVKAPRNEFFAMWEDIHRLEREIAVTRLQLATAHEAAAERFAAIVRAEYPAIFSRVANRAGLEQ